MKKISLLILSIFYFQIFFAQILFKKEYDHASWDNKYSIKETSDHNYILAGQSNAAGFVLKIDTYGDTIWSKNYNPGTLFNCIQLTNDSAYILCGTTINSGSFNDVLLAKIHLNGDTIWTKKVGRPEYDAGTSVQQTSDGGYIVTGITFDSNDRNIYLLKFNAYGDTLWTRIFGGHGHDMGRCVKEAPDGGYVVCGMYDNQGAAGGDVCFIKVDQNGGMVWSKSYGGPEGDYANSVDLTNDGGYILGGSTWSYGAGYQDAYWIKTDGDGNILWTKTFGGWEFEETNEIQQTSDGGFVGVGVTSSFGPGAGHYISMYLIKTNSVGDSMWTSTFGAIGKDTHAHSVRQTFDGGYIMAGPVLTYSGASLKVEVIKTDGLGNDCIPVKTINRVRICSGGSIVVGGHVYHTSGSYVDSLTHGAGCDSIVTTHLIVEPLPVITPYATSSHVCAGSTVALSAIGASTYTWSNGVSNGAYFMPLTTAMYTVTGMDDNGCSNNAVMKIVVDPSPDVSCSMNSGSISSNQSGASYQWINCPGHSIISGANQQVYAPPANGTYAVIIDLNGCIDTSACIDFSAAEVDEAGLTNAGLLIYPNPSHGSFFIQSSGGGSFYLVDGLGQIIRLIKTELKSVCTVMTDDLSPGLYFLIATNNSAKRKVVIR
jgi:hypothetical protein